MNTETTQGDIEMGPEGTEITHLPLHEPIAARTFQAFAVELGISKHDTATLNRFYRWATEFLGRKVTPRGRFTYEDGDQLRYGFRNGTSFTTFE